MKNRLGFGLWCGLGLTALAMLSSPSLAQDIWEPLAGPYANPATKAPPEFRDMLFAPNGDLYVSTRNDGVFRSPDKGKTWTEVNDGLPDKVVHCLGLNARGEVLAGSTVPARLENNGTKWTVAQGEYKVWPGVGVGFTLNRKGEVLLSPSLRQSLFRSTDDGASYQPFYKMPPVYWGVVRVANGDLYGTSEADGVCRSTDDGETWTTLGGRARNLPGTGGNGHCMAMTPKGDILFGSRCPVARYAGGGPGKDWVQFCSGIPLYFKGADGKTMEFNDGWTIVAAPDGKIYVVTNLGVYRSIDDGKTWQEFKAGIAQNPRGRKLLLETDGRLYFAGNDQPKLKMAGGGLYRTIKPVCEMKAYPSTVPAAPAKVFQPPAVAPQPAVPAGQPK